MSFLSKDTICAIATASGTAAVSMIRMSGKDSHKIALSRFIRKKKLTQDAVIPNRMYYGEITDLKDKVIDDVMVTFFKAPHSYTGEDSVEIVCHGSIFIQNKILEILIQSGARLAEAGEYTMRAFVNNKMDLTQAEAVADLISSQNEAEHRVAMNQLKGGFSKELQVLRSKLLDLTSLMELELDFSEEDVEFANRSKLNNLVDETAAKRARANFDNSPWAERLTVEQTAVQEFASAEKFDLIVSNPPYFVDSLLPPDAKRSTARHTHDLTFEELDKAVARLLADGGNAVSDAHARQTVAIIERVITDGGYAVAYIRAREAGAVVECIVTDLGERTERNARQLLTVGEGTFTNAHSFTAQYYIRQIIAVYKCKFTN